MIDWSFIVQYLYKVFKIECKKVACSSLNLWIRSIQHHFQPLTEGSLPSGYCPVLSKQAVPGSDMLIIRSTSGRRNTYISFDWPHHLVDMYAEIIQCRIIKLPCRASFLGKDLKRSWLHFRCGFRFEESHFWLKILILLDNIVCTVSDFEALHIYAILHSIFACNNSFVELFD